jgi:hypothetical protein
MNTIAVFIQTATPEDLRGFEICLVPYKGVCKNDLQVMFNLRKASSPQTKY